MSSAGLEIKGLGKRYGNSVIVDDLSLQVRDGELLVLVGPSGSGKSTLLRLIAGLIPHDSGQLLIGGRDVGDLAPEQRDVAMVFQSYALFPHLSIYDNLAFGLRARKVAKTLIAERIAPVAKALGLEPMLSRFPRQLSGGERQRVALGRAMLREPKLFLMDEPLSNLDAQLRVQTRAEIMRLHQRLKTTIIYVTHDQIEALSMGERIGVLRGGKLEQIGSPKQVYEHPRNLFVARFIGSPPMNTFPVKAAPPDQVAWNGQMLTVPTVRQTGIAPGTALILGVRPEHVFLKGSRWAIGAPPAQTITATVDVVESAGDQLFLLLELAANGVQLEQSPESGKATLIARAEPDFQVKRGDQVELWFYSDAIHLFDASTEVAIGPQP